MTRPNGNIIFNASTGSDTQASGLGPATAVSFTLQTTAGSNVATVSSGSFTSISIGDLMFIPDAAFTGRKFNIISDITPVTNEITFDANWDDTSSSTTGYVGGKRATIDNTDSRRLFASPDAINFQCWTELETDQTITAQMGYYQLKIRIKSADDTIKTITFNPVSDIMMFATDSTFKNIKFISTNSNSVPFWGQGTHSRIYLFNCIVGDSTHPFRVIGHGYTRNPNIYGFDTIFENIKNPTSAWGYPLDSMEGSCTLNASKCFFKNCGSLWGAGDAVSSYNGAIQGGLISDCVFLGDGTNDLYGPYMGRVTNSIISNYRHVANVISDAQPYNAAYTAGSITNCVIHNVTSIVNFNPTTLTKEYHNVSDNYFYNVGSFSNVSGLENYIGQNNTTLTTDPLQIQNGNVQLTNSAGGGYTVRNAEIKL